MIFLIIYTAINIANFKLRKVTSSKTWLIVLSIIMTTFAFVSLFYYQVKEESLSIYLLIAIVFGAFFYQWLIIKLGKERNPEVMEKNNH